MSQAIYRTYRPSSFSEVTGQQHIIKTLQNQFAAGSVAHAYVFMGPRGVGKTTTARLLAKMVNCEDPKENEPCNVCSACAQIANGSALDIYEIDAASHTDVDNVRENIVKSVRFVPNTLKMKVYIIDEVHMLSTSSFNALLKTLEEPPAHVLFILATTEIHKVPDTIISRCQRFDFKRIAEAAMIDRLKGILKKEGVEVDDDVLKEVARHSGGCLRDAESMLGQVLALGDKKITLKEASLVLPATNQVLIEEFCGLLLAQNAKESITKLNAYLEQGIDLIHFIDDVIIFLRNALMKTLSGEESHDLLFIRKTINAFLEARLSAKGDFIPQLPVELAVIEVCSSGVPVPASVDFKEQGVASVRPVEVKKVQVAPAVIQITAQPEYVASVAPVVSSSSQTEVVLKDSPVVVDVADKVFDASVPVISLEEVKEKWPQVFAQIKECNASLPLMMNSCELSDVKEGRVELAFEYDLYVQTVNKEKNRLLIEKVLERVLGTGLKVRAIRSNGDVESDETVSSLLEEFGGSVV